MNEHRDPRRGVHPDWNRFIFNCGRNEVRCFLISNALYRLDRFHIDGLRVDAVASMFYLDYSRKEGEWVPNPHGGRGADSVSCPGRSYSLKLTLPPLSAVFSRSKRTGTDLSRC